MPRKRRIGRKSLRKEVEVFECMFEDKTPTYTSSTCLQVQAWLQISNSARHQVSPMMHEISSQNKIEPKSCIYPLVDSLIVIEVSFVHEVARKTSLKNEDR